MPKYGVRSVSWWNAFSQFVVLKSIELTHMLGSLYTICIPAIPQLVKPIHNILTRNGIIKSSTNMSWCIYSTATLLMLMVFDCKFTVPYIWPKERNCLGASKTPCCFLDQNLACASWKMKPACWKVIWYTSWCIPIEGYAAFFESSTKIEWPVPEISLAWSHQHFS